MKSIKVEQLLGVAFGKSRGRKGICGDLALLLEVRPAERPGGLGKLALSFRRTRGEGSRSVDLYLRVGTLGSTDGPHLFIERRGDLTRRHLRRRGRPAELGLGGQRPLGHDLIADGNGGGRSISEDERAVSGKAALDERAVSRETALDRAL